MKTANQKRTELSTDKIAAYLAAQIIKFQTCSADKLGQWFNAFSIPAKKGITISIGILCILILFAGVFSKLYTMPELSQNYQAAHIGLASEIPEPLVAKSQLIDSLTKKSKSWNQH